MKRLTLFIILAALTISCGNSTGFYPDKYLQFGTWKFDVAENTATWTGSESKSKVLSTTQAEGDTLFFNSTDNRNITIFEYFEGNAFNLFYVDSTINKSMFPDFNSGDDITDVITPFGNNDQTKEGGILAPQYIRNEVVIPFSCDSTYNFDEEVVEINLYKSDGELFRAYHFDASGIEDAVRQIVC